MPTTRGEGFERTRLGKGLPVKTTIVRLTLAFGIASASSGAFAQYYVPPAARPTATYRSPGAPQTAVPQMAQRANAAPYARTAARPMPAAATAPRAAAPSSVPTFRPINPPTTRQAPRALVANRTTPTPAPQIRTASKSQIVPPAAQSAAPMYNPSMSGMGWTPQTPSMSMDAGAGGYGMSGQMAGAPAPVADPGMDYSYGDGGYAGEGGGDCGGGCGGCGRRCGLGGCRACGCCAALWQHGLCVPCKTTGDLVQHMPFFGTTHGYYYFRPYHVMHVFSQQELATRWGGDPRNPYDNTMFHRIYDQMGVEAKPKAPPVGAVPQAGTEYVGPGQMVMPTPVPQYDSPQNYVPSPGNMVPSTVTPLPGLETIAPPTR